MSSFIIPLILYVSRSLEVNSRVRVYAYGLLSISLFLVEETVTIGIVVQQTPLSLTLTHPWRGVRKRETPDGKGRKNGL